MGYPSSAVEIPSGHHRRNHRNYSPEPPLNRQDNRRSPDYLRYNRSSNSSKYSNHNHDVSPSRNHNRSRSPDYSRYDSQNSYRHRSPEYSRSKRNPNPRYESNKLNYSNRNNYLDRNGNGNGNGNESESDEDLKGVSYEDYRRLKRQKYRKMLKRCIWNVTPSPPRGEYDEVELEEEKEVEGDKEKLEDMKNSGSESESESEDSGSDSDDSRSRRKKRKTKSRSKSKSSRSKRRGSVSESESESESESSDDSEEDRRRRKKKSTKRSSKRKSSRRKRRSSSRKSKVSEDSEESSDSEESLKRKRRSRSSSKKRSEKGSEDSASEKNSGSENDAKGKGKVEDGEKPVSESELLAIKEMIESRKKVAVSEDDELVGPQPLPRAEGHISYGGALRPGEGDAIAQYVQQGKRIPRRGEVGLSADEISRYENLGYVMSGSRHQRMNAIRIRKENQVYSAEDKRALAMFNYEEKAKREQKVMSDLQRLVQRHIGEETGPSHDPFGGSGKVTEDPDA